jgi:hypothetical protein
MSDIDAAQSMGWLVNCLPYLEVECNKMKAGIEKRAMDAIRANDLRPSVAVALWQEYAAVDRLLASFRARVKMNETRSERAASAFKLS